MAATDHSRNGIAETCVDCGQETVHDVRIEIRTESEKSENTRYSREPYRVAICQLCGVETVCRMNNA